MNKRNTPSHEEREPKTLHMKLEEIFHGVAADLLIHHIRRVDKESEKARKALQSLMEDQCEQAYRTVLHDLSQNADWENFGPDEQCDRIETILLSAFHRHSVPYDTYISFLGSKREEMMKGKVKPPMEVSPDMEGNGV